VAFSHGSLTRIYCNGRDLTGYFKSHDAATNIDTADVTVFGTTAKQYIPGLVEGSVSLDGFFDATSGTPTVGQDAYMSVLVGVDGTVLSVMPAGDTVGSRAFGLVGQMKKYGIKTDVGSAAQASAEFSSDVGREPVLVHAPLATQSSTGVGTSVDGTTSSSNGGVAYLQCSAVTGSTPTATVKIQHSTDGSTWVDLLTFATVSSAGTAERKTVTGTVNRYTRASWTLSASSSFTLAVTFGRK